MLVVRGYMSVPDDARGAAAAIGNFDGVHRGHQALIAATRAAVANGSAAKTAAIVFDPHPRAFFQSAVPLFELTPLAMKLDLLCRYGLDVAIVLPFERALAALSADEFVARVLCDGLRLRHIVVGYDFHFGKGRSGTVETLRAAGPVAGIGVTVMEPVKAGGDEAASSSRARTALIAGDVVGAADVLGHWWRVSGPVIGGAKRGTGMGYPTANLALAAGVDLAHGIYAVRVYVDDGVHDGAAYLGRRPTFDNGSPVLETFLLDFDGDLYGKAIAIEFIALLREDRHFDGMAALIAQMDIDVADAREALGAVATHDRYRWPEKP